jgi:LmbE family N-acetylglucosaminyl deacetylase
MKSFKWLGVAGALCMSACASTGPTGPSADDQIDQAKIQAIEQAAKAYGVRVYWITMPRKAAAAQPVQSE